MPGIWLFSTDPETCSFEDLLRKGRDLWDGVKNPLANRFLREVRRGDAVLGFGSPSRCGR
ncbi:MAG: EVE domain-containing protein [Halobacteria archaeon]